MKRRGFLAAILAPLVAPLVAMGKDGEHFWPVGVRRIGRNFPVWLRVVEPEEVRRYYVKYPDGQIAFIGFLETRRRLQRAALAKEI